MDLLNHFRGDGRPWGVTHSWAGTGQMQSQDGALAQQFFLVKGIAGVQNPWEEFRYDSTYIYRGYDISPSDGTFYRLTDPGLPVSAWNKRDMVVGENFRRNPLVTRYSASGSIIAQANHMTWLKFAAYHTNWTSGVGYTVPNVAEIRVYDGDAALAAGAWFEIYFFALNVGMVGWRGDINGSPATTDVNFIWGAPTGPGIPHLDRKPLPGGLTFEPMPTGGGGVIINPPLNPPVTVMTIQTGINARVRSTPSTTGAQIALLPGGTPVNVVRTVPGLDGDGFKWHLRDVGGYIREDLFVGYTPASPIPTPRALYAPPVKGYTLGTGDSNTHHGIDLGLTKDVEVTASATGQVAFLYYCQKCSREKPNFVSNRLTPPQIARAMQSADWGYGYGFGVVVRYDYPNLPDVTRAELDRLGLTNGSVYAMHAHMSELRVVPMQTVSAGTVLGISGSTGNTTERELHLETRASARRNETIFSSLTKINPTLMYALG